MKESILPQKKLSSSLEDYIEAIYNLSNSEGKVRSIDIARKLGVSRASVSEAVQKLAKDGLVDYTKYDDVAITSKGKKAAEEVISRHKIFTEFFAKVLGVEQKEAEENACRIEHVISPAVYINLKAYIDFLNQNPELIQKFKSKD